MGSGTASPTVRSAEPDDLDDVIALAATALGWDPDQPNDALFRWKHLDNPFGPSPILLAEVDGRLAGIRVFLRWRFRRPDGSTAVAVRAVDTATHPDFQGRGIFSALTRAAIDDLKTSGVDFVFNTPNDKSRPGYLKMGWVEVGHVPVRIKPTSVLAPVRMLRSRTPAEKWSAPSTAGETATTVIERMGDALPALLSRAFRDGYRTDRSVDYLRWRYSFAPLGYRVIGGDDGVCVFRTRKRGDALEATICEFLVPDPRSGAGRELASDVARSTGADYLIFATSGPGWAAGCVPLPRQGPMLTWRALNQTEAPALDAWNLSLGDVELF